MMVDMDVDGRGDDIRKLAETQENIARIENGEKHVIDPETEIEGYRMIYTETYQEAVFADDLVSIEVLDDPDDHPDHPVRVETDRFEMIAKFGDETHGTTDEVIYAMMEHKELDLTYNQVNGDITAWITENLP